MKKENAKKIGTKNDFSNEVLKALHVLSDPVKATLGPDGLPILLEQKGNKPPLMTKDGVTVAMSIFSSDPVTDTIIQSIKEASMKTNEEVGDGTTTAIVLTEALIEEGMKYINSGLISPQLLVSQIRNTLPRVLSGLKDQVREIKEETEIKYVASISSNNDNEVAEKVTEAVMKSGKDGVAILEDGVTANIEVHQVQGYQVKNGWSDHKIFATRMMTDVQKQEVYFAHNPSVLCYDGEMTDLGEFADFIIAFNQIDQTTHKHGEIHQLTILAHKFSGQIRQMVAENMVQNGLPIMLVETEMLMTPNSQILMLSDVAAYTGGEVVQQGTLRQHIQRGAGPTTSKLTDEVLGQCERVRQIKNITTFYDGFATEESLEEHMNIIKKQINDAEHNWDSQIHKKRIARLVDGVVSVQVGGTTILEIQEKKARVEDALNATKAALKEGIVPGGGVALLNCTQCLKKDYDDIEFGISIFKTMLQAPLRQIVKNSDQSDDIIIHELLTSDTVCDKIGVLGYDALKRKIVGDVFESGIVDPYLVVQTALKNAVSIGCEILRGGGYCVFAKDSAEVDPTEMFAVDATQEQG